MLDPEYIVSFYIATYGQNGNNLGCDEKEIILLVYIIINRSTGDIVATKQILVRPNPGWNESDAALESTISATPSLDHKSITSNNSVISIEASNSTGPSLNGGIPIIEVQANGKSLSDALEEFNSFLHSHSINQKDIILVTDGQLPLRQCLHPEACGKGIILTDVYNKFSDLRKEFRKFKSGDLSKALVPVKDVKKILQIPLKPVPNSIKEIFEELNLEASTVNNFYIRESYDMAFIIQHMLKSGHKFLADENINLILEPGICSIDDEVDGNCIVRARGLPWQSSDQDIAKFFRGLNVSKGGVALCLSPLGRRNGEALIRFVSQEHRDMALKRHKHHIGPRYIEVYRATGEDFLSVAGGASNEAQAFLSKGAQVIIRMRGLPYDCTAKQVLDFFTTGDSPCEVLDGSDGVLFVKKADGRATGDAFVLFANEGDAPKALSRHRESIGQRYIELFRSTTAEVQQVLNRCMDPKTYESNHIQAPLISQLPTVPISLLPQHLITSGTIKNCIRLRGLPYEALVEHILHFLDEFAKHIIYQGVHMVINAQGQPSGEAFIQMDSEETAKLCAQRKHNHFMVFGKKYRYIEVFQCSGDDMNMVLNGGLQSSLVPPAHSTSTTGKQTSILSPGMLVQPQQANAQSLTSHNHAHIPHANHAIQTSPSISSTLALAQPSHIPLSALCPTSNVGIGASAASANGLQTFVPQSNITSAASISQNAGLIAPQNSLALAGAPGQLALPTLAMGNPTLTGLPFNIHLPPTQISSSPSNNSALLAQQAQVQAQFIAQQSLLARQQNSTVPVEQQGFYANMMNPLFLPHSSSTPLTPPLFSTSSAQPHLMFMPRPYFHPMPIGYSMSPPSFTLGTVPPANVHSTTNPSVTNLQQTMKRSYENAFHQDTNNTASVPKRTFSRTPSNTYYQFYNP